MPGDEPRGPGATSALVADHEPEVAELARRYLFRAGLPVRVVTTPEETAGALASRAAGLFVIDLTMPGLEVIRLRRALASGPPVPVVFLLDRYGIRPRGLTAGGAASAADRRWLVRPFSPRALVDAVTELLRCASTRPPGLPGVCANSGVPGTSLLLLDSARRQVSVAGRAIGLTRTEFALLTALARHPGRPLSREQLLAALEAERGKRPTARAVDVYVTQLRAKLGADAIRTVHGVGYCVSPPGADDLLAPGGRPPGDPPPGGLPSPQTPRGPRHLRAMGRYCGGKFQGGRRERLAARASIGGATFPI